MKTIPFCGIWFQRIEESNTLLLYSSVILSLYYWTNHIHHQYPFYMKNWNVPWVSSETFYVATVAKETTSLISMCPTCQSHFASSYPWANTAAWSKEKREVKNKTKEAENCFLSNYIFIPVGVNSGFFYITSALVFWYTIVACNRLRNSL